MNWASGWVTRILCTGLLQPLPQLDMEIFMQ